ncbi:hypothetical protein NQ314_009968 [Rhamnusium bicolor]|uniref:Uncharacterized protein n=1 Tax=Rhamnusium bicolor TaxID=1586634 RepID=A0AAV8XWC5_9CUCU|nr:hypothetical protein NQ314_009968 [Rhamnusium bicolor]
MSLHWMAPFYDYGVHQWATINERAIGESIYKLDWQDIDNALQKDLIMVMLRCQRPKFLHAGPFGHMTYAMIVTAMLLRAITPPLLMITMSMRVFIISLPHTIMDLPPKGMVSCTAFGISVTFSKFRPDTSIITL